MLDVGKYQGQSYGQVLQSDPDYCHWVLSKSQDPDSSMALQHFAAWLADQEVPEPTAVAADSDELIISFGKHRGKSYEEVLQEEPDFCRWALSKAQDPDSSMALRHFAA